MSRATFLLFFFSRLEGPRVAGLNAGQPMLGRELSPEEGEQHAELVRSAEIKELDPRKEFDVFGPRKDRKVSGQIAQTRWVLA